MGEVGLCPMTVLGVEGSRADLDLGRVDEQRRAGDSHCVSVGPQGGGEVVQQGLSVDGSWCHGAKGVLVEADGLVEVGGVTVTGVPGLECASEVVDQPGSVGAAWWGSCEGLLEVDDGGVEVGGVTVACVSGPQRDGEAA